jgi:hypothetical protein
LTSTPAPLTLAALIGGTPVHRHFMIIVAGSLTLQGCSSRPREFTPTLAAAPVDHAAFDTAYSTCAQLLADGKLDREGRLASAAGGAAAGGAGLAVGSATAAAVAGYGGMAVVAATVVLLPFAVVGGAVGMAKMKRARKEKAIRTAMEGCLHERGYTVTQWVKVKKTRGAAKEI